MNTHNTLAEDIYSKVSKTLQLNMLRFPADGEDSFENGIGDDVRDSILERAGSLLEQEYPVITLSDYRIFSRTGDRDSFENKYFTRRKMLTSLVTAECIEGKGRFLDKILDGMYLIMDETTWCIPAHNTYIRDEKQLEIPDTERPVIDLFAAETAAILGVAENVLRDSLNRISPLIGDRIDGEIDRRILKPYLSYHFWWMGNGLEPMCNWTVWITQNILLAVFSRQKDHVDEKALYKVLEQAVRSVDYFLDEYGEDGCCNEGAQYYSHAGLCLFGCIDVLDRITDGAFKCMYEDRLVRSIASYILKMYVGDGYYINYADCSPFPGRRGIRDYLFALNTANASYAAFAAGDYKGMTVDEQTEPDEQNLYYHLLQLMYHNRVMAHEDTEIIVGDSFFKSVGLFVARDDRYTLAVKAGNNADSHNHNDVGSITLYKDRKPYLIDIGVETYTAKTFSDRRYEIWTMQSVYHNTVNFMDEDSIDGKPDIAQRDGEAYGAADVRTETSDRESVIEFEMADAYGDSRIESCRRKVRLVRGEAVLIEDSFCMKPGVRAVLTMMLYERPEIIADKDGGNIVVKVGTLGEIKARGIEKAETEVCPIADERLKIAWKHECYRVLLYVDGDRVEIRIQ